VESGSRSAGVVAVVYGAAALFVWAGFLFGASRDPWLFGFSRSYVAFLAGSAVALAVPLVLFGLTLRVGWRRALSEAAPTLGLLVVGYLAAAGYYGATRTHEFDPYLQNPPTLIADVHRPRAADELRVAALGGSTTESSMLAEAERYPTRLREALGVAFPGRRVEVFNGGRNWWTTKHSLIHYATHVRWWSPDVVVVMHAINDLYRSCESDQYAIGEYTPTWSHYYGPSIRGARPPSLPSVLLGRVQRSMYLQWYRNWRIREVDYPAEHYRSIAEYELNLRSLAAVVRADGAMLVIVTQGSLYKEEPSAEELAVIRFGEEFCMTARPGLSAEFPSPWSLRRGMDEFNAVARRVAAEEGAILVDVEARLDRTLEVFVDDVHHTAAGAATVAAEVSAAIATALASPGELDPR